MALHDKLQTGSQLQSGLLWVGGEGGGNKNKPLMMWNAVQYTQALKTAERFDGLINRKLNHDPITMRKDEMSDDFIYLFFLKGTFM